MSSSDEPVVRVATEADIDGIWDVFRMAFGQPATARERWVSALDPSRCRVVDGPHGEIAAASHIAVLGQWFGGRRVPLAGYSPVAVRPEHRGSGLARAVTAGHYADLRERGEVLAGLFPSSVGLYRSVGFELAGSQVERRIPAPHLAALRSPRASDVRVAGDHDLPAIRELYARLGPGTDGLVDRPEAWWARRLPPGDPERFTYVVDGPEPGTLAGAATWTHGKGRPPWGYSVRVHEVLAADSDVLRALWAVAGSSGSQAPDVHVVGPAEDPLFLLLGMADPAAVVSEIRWMLRLIDAPGAFAARGWPTTTSGSVDLDVTDEHAPWNTGPWRLTIDGGEARLEPGGDGAVQLGIGALSTLWSGYQPARTLAAHGLVRTADHDALATLDALTRGNAPIIRDFY